MRRNSRTGVLAWSRIELATILLKQGKTAQAMAKLEQAATLLHQGKGQTA